MLVYPVSKAWHKNPLVYICMCLFWKQYQTFSLGLKKYLPDSKVNGANMGPIWGRQDPGGPHVGPMNFAIWAIVQEFTLLVKHDTGIHWFAYTWAYFENNIKHSALNWISTSLIVRFMGPTWGPTGPRWAPCWPHELCYLGYCTRVFLACHPTSSFILMPGLSHFGA